jgi:hypothetical protein
MSHRFARFMIVRRFGRAQARHRQCEFKQPFEKNAKELESQWLENAIGAKCRRQRNPSVQLLIVCVRYGSREKARSELAETKGTRRIPMTGRGRTLSKKRKEPGANLGS